MNMVMSPDLLGSLCAVDLITAIVAYVDQVECVFYPAPPPYLREQLKLLNGGRFFRRRVRGKKRPRPKIRKGTVWVLTQPTRAALRYLAAHRFYSFGERTNRPTFSVWRVDIAFDFITRSPADAKIVGEFLEACLLQKWRGRRRTNGFATTMYWSGPKTTRNIAVYSDLPSKTGSGPCAHLELRHFTANKCRLYGLDNLKGLAAGINAAALLERETRLAFTGQKTFDRHLERTAQAVKRGDEKFVLTDLYEVQRILERIIAAMIQNEIRTPEPGSIEGARGQDIYDALKKLRRTMIPIMWQEIVDPPRWVHNKP